MFITKNQCQLCGLCVFVEEAIFVYDIRSLVTVETMRKSKNSGITCNDQRFTIKVRTTEEFVPREKVVVKRWL